MDICNVVWTSLNGISSQYLITDIMCHVEGFDKTRAYDIIKEEKHLLFDVLLRILCQWSVYSCQTELFLSVCNVCAS